MLDVAIPGYRQLLLSNLVLDFNGTLASGGRLLDGIAAQLATLSNQLCIYVVTGNTYGTATEQLKEMPCKVTLLSSEGQAAAKREFVQHLGMESVSAIGNGRNDVQMMRSAALSIAVIGEEGAASEAITSADVVVRDIRAALDLLLQPKRLIATLRA